MAWSAKTSKLQVIEWLWNCEEYKQYRRYPHKPMTSEEDDFPIAYIIVAHKDAAQIERLFRAIYQPQNIYCIHPDLKSPANFQHAIHKLASCFPNIIIPPKLENIQWGNFSRLMADIHCMRELLNHPVQWKYLLNLCGQDFPLKTNLEIVQLMKTYNGKNYIEGGKVGPDSDDNFAWRTRFKFYSNSSDGYIPPQNSGYVKRPPPYNITIYKGDNYMAATREFVDFMVKDPRAIAFLQWCNDTYLPEETFPNSLHRSIGAPGGEITEMKESYIRFRKWAEDLKNPSCRGKFVRQLCIFESNYLEHLYDVPHLFVNKFYYDYDPITMQCMEELLDYRSRHLKT
ncbi:beta-1,3-galactosyl-O-glycosyl-glycoprotein beta-1,6-N-acetylglucosaminyltransferase 4-like [Amphiura filiformis]|uniref:beta-1,3-galactosyl-O-glycosyl-glycoprotein beta-1,6-N-acetylglucosaminyltransferase 4-like n=1 Tax=Amphiura filiformis TaxID=82378 RepID=UPI003B21B65D